MEEYESSEIVYNYTYVFNTQILYTYTPNEGWVALSCWWNIISSK